MFYITVINTNASPAYARCGGVKLVATPSQRTNTGRVHAERDGAALGVALFVTENAARTAAHACRVTVSDGY